MSWLEMTKCILVHIGAEWGFKFWIQCCILEHWVFIIQLYLVIMSHLLRHAEHSKQFPHHSGNIEESDRRFLGLVLYIFINHLDGEMECN